MTDPISPRQARTALGVLSVVYAVNLLDRQILSMLLVPIQQDLGVSDTALGFLTGTAFALFYAVAEASDLARAQADIVLLRGALTQVPALLHAALHTRRVIRQNFAWALGYNTLAIPLAALGLVPPWAAAIGMSLSSLLVVGNSLRLRALR